MGHHPHEPKWPRGIRCSISTRMASPALQPFSGGCTQLATPKVLLITGCMSKLIAPQSALPDRPSGRTNAGEGVALRSAAGGCSPASSQQRNEHLSRGTICWPNQQSAGGGSSAKRSSTRRSIVKVSNLGKHGGETHGTYEVRLTPPLLTQWRHKTRRNTHHRWSACSSSHLGAAQRRLFSHTARLGPAASTHTATTLAQARGSARLARGTWNSCAHSSSTLNHFAKQGR